jgi:hypothetical protein
MNTNNIQTRQTAGSLARTISAGLGIVSVLSFSAAELSARSAGRPDHSSPATASHSQPASGMRHVNMAPTSSSTHQQPGTSGSRYQPGSSTTHQQPGTSGSRFQPGSSSTHQQPGTSGSRFQPGSSSTHQQPGTSGSRFQPGSSSTHQQPGTSGSRFQPGSSTTSLGHDRFPQPGHNGSSFVSHDRPNDHTYVNVRDGHRDFEHSRFSHIPEGRFRSSFGRGHEFRVGQLAMFGGHRSFRFGGVSFGLMRPWPARWAYTDAVYVDYIDGSYFLCNRMDPSVQIPVDVDQCDTCAAAPEQPVAATLASCNECNQPVMQPVAQVCNQCGAPSVPTLTRGQTAGEVVALLGDPTRIINLGFRQIFVYPDMRVTFIGGRMSDAR